MDAPTHGASDLVLIARALGEPAQDAFRMKALVAVDPPAKSVYHFLGGLAENTT